MIREAYIGGWVIKTGIDEVDSPVAVFQGQNMKGVSVRQVRNVRANEPPERAMGLSR